MKRLIILGAGTGGTIMANKLSRALDLDEWEITIVDQYEIHYYQPGLLFIPFGIYTRNDIIKPKRDFIPPGVNLIISGIDRIIPDKNQVLLADGRFLEYDFLIISTGTKIWPEETPGLKDKNWFVNIFDFYTVEGATSLRNFIKYWKGGKLVLNITEMPIKCPVAPLEFLFLADWYFTEMGLRDKVEIEFVTPLSGAFTKPRAAQKFGDFLSKKNIKLNTEFNIMEVDWEKNIIRSYDNREVDYDLLVSIPTNMGDPAIERSGIGDEMNYVPTDKHTLMAKGFDNIFCLGDAADLPTSKAGSVAHFAAEVLTDNFLNVIDGQEPQPHFDGHANCYIESGFGKGLLIDFNYDTEPLPGKFPLPGIGPFSLLEESRMNHWGKVMFRWMYWHLLLRGAKLPITTEMIMAGKWL